MKALALLFLGMCVAGLMAWRHDRVRIDCAGNPEDACAYRMMRIRGVEIVGPCMGCCDDTDPCENWCATSCGYTFLPEEEVVREEDTTPGDPGEFCFDWDAGMNGPAPPVGEVWILRVVAEDAAGNLSGCP